MPLYVSSINSQYKRYLCVKCNSYPYLFLFDVQIHYVYCYNQTKAGVVSEVAEGCHSHICRSAGNPEGVIQTSPRNCPVLK